MSCSTHCDTGARQICKRQALIGQQVILWESFECLFRPKRAEALPCGLGQTDAGVMARRLQFLTCTLSGADTTASETSGLRAEVKADHPGQHCASQAKSASTHRGVSNHARKVFCVELMALRTIMHAST